MTAPTVLAVARLSDYLTERLRSTFDLHDRTHLQSPDALDAIAGRVRAIAASGESKVPRELMTRLPALEIISVFGVGYDGIDLAAARERGLVVTNTPDVLTEDVADLAIGLMLTVARRIVLADRFVRASRWSEGPFGLSAKVNGARLGIVGLGRIGQAIARRAEGFGMQIAYCNRRRRDDVAYRYLPTPRDLAAESDFLVVSTVGGPSTRGLIDAAVLDALGPQGTLINVARGSIVDQPALIDALRSGRLGAAGLDVFTDEPRVPAELMAMEQVVLSPHLGSATAATRQAMADLAFANLSAHFSGKPVLTPVV